MQKKICYACVRVAFDLKFFVRFVRFVIFIIRILSVTGRPVTPCLSMKKVTRFKLKFARRVRVVRFLNPIACVGARRDRAPAVLASPRPLDSSALVRRSAARFAFEFSRCCCGRAARRPFAFRASCLLARCRCLRFRRSRRSRAACALLMLTENEKRFSISRGLRAVVDRK